MDRKSVSAERFVLSFVTGLIYNLYTTGSMFYSCMIHVCNKLNIKR